MFVGNIPPSDRVSTRPEVVASRIEAFNNLSSSDSFDKLMDIIFKTNEEKGWHDEPRSFGEEISLFHSELSEALEAFRQGHEVTEIWLEQDKDGNLKPEGVPIELADCIIRIMDFCSGQNIDLWGALIAKARYNTTRRYRHGGKTL